MNYSGNGNRQPGKVYTAEDIPEKLLRCAAQCLFLDGDGTYECKKHGVSSEILPAWYRRIGESNGRTLHAPDETHPEYIAFMKKRVSDTQAEAERFRKANGIG